MSPNPLDQLPNFFLLGVAKSGTTSLHSYLAQHPAIFISEPKEPHFFDDDIRYRRGLDYYRATYFAGAVGYPRRGEATPRYFRLPVKVIPRFDAAFPRVPLKFILIFREPVARLWSHYRFEASRNGDQTPLEEVLDAYETGSTHPSRLAYLLTANLYAPNLRAWLEHYDRAQFHFLLTEDLRQPTVNDTMKQIFRFLEVDDSVSVETTYRKNVAPRSRWPRLIALVMRSGILRILAPDLDRRRKLRQQLYRLLLQDDPSPPKINPATAARLAELYRDDVRELATLIGRDLSAWETHLSSTQG